MSQHTSGGRATNGNGKQMPHLSVTAATSHSESAHLQVSQAIVREDQPLYVGRRLCRHPAQVA